MIALAGEIMLISPEQHADYQQRVVQQLAGRLGLSWSQFDSVDKLLGMIEQKDLIAFHAITQFKNAYREWFEACAMLESAVSAGHQEETETMFDKFRDLRTRRDYQLKLLVGYLDKTYPSHS
jgi:hypothetical protein